MQDQMQPQNQLPNGEPDHEGAMAKADLYKLANYSLKLFKTMDDNAQIEAWVQAKITKAADYIASVYHYMEYEMKFSEYGAKLENSDIYNEDQKREIKGKLTEAKEKMKALKIKQAEKVSDKKTVEEGILSGGERACTECGGTGTVYEEPKAVPEEVKSKVEKYNRKTKAFHAANKRLDRNNNGIPDSMEDKDVAEETSSTGGKITRPSKGVTKHTQNPDRFSDEPHVEPASQAKSKSSAEKKAEKEKDIKLPKHPKDKTWGMKGGEKFGKDVPKAKKEKEVEVDENIGQGVYEGEEPKDKPKKGEKIGKEGNAFGKAVRDAKASGDKTVTIGDKTIPVKEAAKPDANKDGIPDYAQDGKGAKDLGKGKGGAPKKGVNPFAKKDEKVDEAEKTMSRAAKGHEKYGKEGMAALAKAGKEGKSLEPVRAKYNKYDESTSGAEMIAESVEIDRIRFLSGL
jgi:hypothetical protein